MTGPTHMHRLLPVTLVLAIATGVFHIYIGALNLAGMNPAVPVEARYSSSSGRTDVSRLCASSRLLFCESWMVMGWCAGARTATAAATGGRWRRGLRLRPAA